MSLSINPRPAQVCYVREPILYSIATTDSTDQYVDLTFSVRTTPGLTVSTFTLRAWFVKLHAMVYLQDILRDYVSSLTVQNSAIVGQVRFWLSAVGGSTTHELVEDPDNTPAHRHYAFPGEKPATGYSTTRSPFLLAREARRGTLHLYASEVNSPIYFLNMGYRQNNTECLLLYNGVESGLTPYHADVEGDYYPLFALPLTVNPGVRDFLMRLDGQLSAWRLVVDEDPVAEEKHVLQWTNKYGAPERLLCTGRMYLQPTFDEPATYLQGAAPSFQTRSRRQTGVRWLTRRYTLHTGYLTEDRFSALLDMLCSARVTLDSTAVTVTADINRPVLPDEPQSYELQVEELIQRVSPDNSRVVAATAPLPTYIFDHNDAFILDRNTEPLHSR